MIKSSFVKCNITELLSSEKIVVVLIHLGELHLLRLELGKFRLWVVVLNQSSHLGKFVVLKFGEKSGNLGEVGILVSV